MLVRHEPKPQPKQYVHQQKSLQSIAEMIDTPIFGRRCGVKPSHICIALLLILNTIFQVNNYQNSRFESVVVTGSAGVATGSRSITYITEAAVGNHITSLKNTDELLVQYGDSIYMQNNWDGAPIVIEQYKLLFFSSAKVGCTTWKQLFRRMMNITDYTLEEYDTLIPWNPEMNGLRYLYHYNRSTASSMMTDPTWTRAIFVRDPKVRFLSAYLDKGVQNSDYVRSKCCAYTGTCAETAKVSIANFIELMYRCSDSHWNPQSKRILEDKYWPYINYVGHMESIYQDARVLLEQIGAWETNGQSGWGPTRNDAIFESKAGGIGRLHATEAVLKLKSYITPEIEAVLEQYYADDYNNNVLNLTLEKIYNVDENESQNRQRYVKGR